MIATSQNIKRLDITEKLGKPTIELRGHDEHNEESDRIWDKNYLYV